MLTHGLHQFDDINRLARVEGIGVNIIHVHISQLGMGAGANQALNSLVFTPQEIGATQGRQFLLTLFRHV